MSRNSATKSPPAAAPSSSDRAARAAAREQQMALAAAAAAANPPHHPHKPTLSRQAGTEPTAATAAAASSSSSAAAAPASPARAPVAAASSSSSSAAPASTSPSTLSLAAVGGALPSTSAACTHRAAHAHLVLPHSASQREFWSGVVLAKLAPLAKYYRANVAGAQRPVAPAAPAAAAAASSSSSSSAAAAAAQADDDPDVQMAAASQQPADDGIDEDEEGETVSAGAGSSGRRNSNNGGKKGGPTRLWARFEVTDAISAPISNISGLVALLRSTRHPASQSMSFTGKSLAHTLGDVMHPADTQHFLRVLVPFLAHLVMRLPELFPEGATCLPLLVTGVEATVTLSAAQCACLVACQFFSLFSPKVQDAGTHPRDSPWPSCNMDAFFSVMRAPMSGKHMLLFNYFARIENPAEGITPNRFVSFHRRVLPAEMVSLVADDAKFSASTVPLSAAIYRDEGCIEDAPHSLQVDFANRYIGGGVLYTGCVQEEIRFCLSPECLVSMVLAERLEDAESLILLGPKMYSHYAGYGTSLVFGGNCADEGLQPDEFGRLSNAIVAIDAVDFQHNDGSDEDDLTPASQWKAELMARETVKAIAGFSVPHEIMGSRFTYDSVATGNWGCGAFGGFVPLKFLLQWLSASLSGRALIYFSFSNPLAQSIPLFVQAIEREFGSGATAATATAATQPAPVKWGSGATGTPPPPPAAAAAAAAASSSSSSSSGLTVGELWRALRTVAPRWSRARDSDISRNHDGLFADLIKAIKQQRGRAKY